jgi:hypothetical protein
MKRNKLSKETLELLLSENNNSVGMVASKLNIPYSTVRAWYRSYKIKLQPSCETVFDELRTIPFSDIHKSVILGSILGDGSLIKQSKSKNARLQIGHCTKQLGYLNWKKELLNPFSTKIVEARKPGPMVVCGTPCYNTGYFLMNTISHPDITSYYYKYYHGGKKRVHEDIINELDLLSLAIWLADDGSFSFQTNSKTALRGSIATCSFTKDEIEILIVALRRFFDGNLYIDNWDNRITVTGTKAINDLLDKITNILPKCIHYKFVPQRLNSKAPLIEGEDIV